MGATIGCDLEEEVENIERPSEDGVLASRQKLSKGARSRLATALLIRRIQTGKKEDEVWQ